MEGQPFLMKSVLSSELPCQSQLSFLLGWRVRHSRRSIHYRNELHMREQGQAGERSHFALQRSLPFARRRIYADVDPAISQRGQNERNETNTMKAIRIHGRGGPDRLVYEDVPPPHPDPGEVLVRVYAAGVIATELQWDETYQTKVGSPRSLPIPGPDLSQEW